MKLLFLPFLLIAGSLGLFAFSCSQQNLSKLIAQTAQNQLDSLKVHSQTPKGTKVLSKSPVSVDELNAFDAGFDLADLKATKYGFPILNRTSYTILYIPAITDYASDHTFAPSFAVPINCKPATADAFCGSEYDKGAYSLNGQVVSKQMHYIWAAEQVAFVGQNYIAVAQAKNPSAEFIARAVSYGCEHELLRLNNPAAYQQSLLATHQHPLLPLDDGR